MKWTIHIFTVYMFALALVPCGDGGGGIAEMMSHFFEIEHQVFSDHDQHSNTCNDDHCSPFCVCSCCSTAVDSPVRLTIELSSPAPVTETVPSFVPNLLPSSFLTSIWQPPRFC